MRQARSFGHAQPMAQRNCAPRWKRRRVRRVSNQLSYRVPLYPSEALSNLNLCTRDVGLAAAQRYGVSNSSYVRTISHKSFLKSGIRQSRKRNQTPGLFCPSSPTPTRENWQKSSVFANLYLAQSLGTSFEFHQRGELYSCV